MNRVAAYLEGTNDAAYMVHRLDQETSGAMIVAKNPVVVPILDQLISTGEIHRDYLALVAGVPNPARGIWDLPLGQDPTDVRKRKVFGKNAQSARTHYRTLAVNGDQARLWATRCTARWRLPGCIYTGWPRNWWSPFR